MQARRPASAKQNPYIRPASAHERPDVYRSKTPANESYSSVRRDDETNSNSNDNQVPNDEEAPKVSGLAHLKASVMGSHQENFEVDGI